MKYAIRTILFLTFLYTSWFKFSSYLKNYNVSVVVQSDGQLSDEARSVVKVYVQNLLKKTVNLPEIALAVRRSFAYVDNITISKEPSSLFKVSLYVTEPIALCNNKFTVCLNDHIFDKNIFNKSFVESIPHYTVDTKLASFDSKAFKKFVINIPSEILDLYHITWHDSQKIYLQDKSYPAITLVANQTMIKDVSNIKLAYSEIRNSLMERLQKTPEKKRSKLAWLVDGRFKNQMIVIPKGVVS